MAFDPLGAFFSAISSPAGGLGVSLLAANQQNQQNQQFQQLTQQDINQLQAALRQSGGGNIRNQTQLSQNIAGRAQQLSTGDFRENFRNLNQAFGANSGIQQGLQQIPQQFQQGAQGLNQTFARGAQGINQGFQNRLNTGLGILQGSGAQERRDINRQFNQANAAQQANLTSRGLGGSTINSAVSSQNERNRAGALGGLNERLLQQRLGTFSQLSGQGLSARERLLGAQTGLGQGLLGASAGLGLQSLGQQGANSQFLQNSLANIRQQNFANQFATGQQQLGVNQQQFQNVLNTLGPIQRVPPQQLQFPQIPSSVR